MQAKEWKENKDRQKLKKEKSWFIEYYEEKKYGTRKKRIKNRKKKDIKKVNSIKKTVTKVKKERKFVENIKN